MQTVVKIHCGNGHVRGKAARYPYVIASLFVQTARQDGVLVWRNAGTACGPFRSQAKCERLAKQYASDHNLEFIPGYGSLHNTVCKSQQASLAGV